MHDPKATGNDFFKCDFCMKPWSEGLPMVEGHQGSLICAHCLSVAYTALALNNENSAPAGYTCSMCLEQRDDPAWVSPIRAEGVICKRCARQAATGLQKDPDSNWQKPVRTPVDEA